MLRRPHAQLSRATSRGSVPGSFGDLAQEQDVPATETRDAHSGLLAGPGDRRDRHGPIVLPSGPARQGRHDGRTTGTTPAAWPRATISLMIKHNTELGATLRAWRDRLSPAAAGLPRGRLRQSPGLRREELAELAGISVDYVVRLEQGRSTTPSARVAAALARALQLTSAERDHLYRRCWLKAPSKFSLGPGTPLTSCTLTTLTGSPR
jgi:DNA-binding XRE family transcriptional regulator